MAHENDWVADVISRQKTNVWRFKEWNNYTPYIASSVWTDGTNVYYSDGSNQYVLDKSTSTWNPKTWSGLSSFDGYGIWTDGNNIYYSNGSDQYVLNKDTSTWTPKTWNGFTNFYGNHVWTDGDNIYYSYGNNEYVLNKDTSTWTQKTWIGITSLSSFRAIYIWKDDDNIYYSYNSAQYVLNKSTSTWTPKTWGGITSFIGQYIWTDGENYYLSRGNGGQYVLNKSTGTWTPKTWVSIPNAFYGHYIWTDGENCYFSNGGVQYELESELITNTPYRLNFPEMIESVDLHDKWVSDVIEDKPDVWIEKDWGELVPLSGSGIWSDGDNLYYLGGIRSYVYNKSEKIWENKTWYGLDSIPGSERSGSNIWTDGENIYYSYYNKHFILDRATSTWNTKTWSGRSEFYGSGVWTDGENIYLSGGNANYQFVLNKATSTWEAKTWSGYQNIIAGHVWFDGDNIYYSQSSNQYILDKATSTWVPKTWNGITPSNGGSIWNRNGKIYYSDGANQLVLDSETSTWSRQTWSGLTLIYKTGIWSDGEEIYYSYSGNQCMLTDIKITTVPYRYDFPEMIESVDIDNAWITHDVPDPATEGLRNAVPYRLAFPEIVESIDITDKWLISDDIPFRWNFPKLIESSANPVRPPSYFIFKGKSSAEFGSIEILPLCLKHEEKTDFINFIYGNPYVSETSILRSKVITITLNLSDISSANIDRVNAWLIGTGKLVLSHDPHRYYIATCNNALTGQKLVNTLGKVAVQFNVMPYKYDLKEKDSFEPADLAEEALHKTAAIYYKGSAPAESTFKITATGNIEIYNVQTEKIVEIKGLTEYCIIDIKARKVTDESNLNILNRTYGDIFDLMLVPGYNYFFLSGSVTAVEVKKKTRWY